MAVAQGARHVLVVGGGVGGLSTTIALRRAGFAVDVVEKSPAWDVYGVGIIQPGNALRALHELGLAEQCVAQGQAILGDRAYLADGATLLADNDWPPLVPGLPPGNGITRPRLHRILQDAVLASGADVRTGVTVSSLDDGEVAFSDGETRRYDVVVGADGLHSQIRELVFPDAPRPRPTGQVVWRYNLPRLDGLDKIWVYIGAAGTAGFVPLAPDLMYMLTIEKPPNGTPARLPQEGLAAIYRERLAQFAGPVAELRELVVDDAADATSPHAGQGAAQAIEDGLVLTEELLRHDSLDDALAAFTQRRYERCRVIVEGSEAIGAWEMDHSLAIDPSAKRLEVTIAAMAPI